MNNIHVVEMSFDENSFLFKTGQEIDTKQIYPMFKDNQRDAVLQRYLLDSQLFAKRFREVSGRSLIVPRRIGADEVSPKQFQQKSEKVFREHRQHGKEKFAFLAKGHLPLSLLLLKDQESLAEYTPSKGQCALFSWIYESCDLPLLWEDPSLGHVQYTHEPYYQSRRALFQ